MRLASPQRMPNEPTQSQYLLDGGSVRSWKWSIARNASRNPKKEVAAATRWNWSGQRVALNHQSRYSVHGMPRRPGAPQVMVFAPGVSIPETRVSIARVWKKIETG